MFCTLLRLIFVTFLYIKLVAVTRASNACMYFEMLLIKELVLFIDMANALSTNFDRPQVLQSLHTCWNRARFDVALIEMSLFIQFQL